MTSKKLAMEQLLLGKGLPISKQELLPFPGWLQELIWTHGA